MSSENSAEVIPNRDEYAEIAQNLYAAKITSSVRSGFFSSVPNAFTGRLFVDSFVETFSGKQRQDAVKVGQALLDRMFIVVPSADIDPNQSPTFRDAANAVYQLPLGAAVQNTFESGVLNTKQLCVSKQRDASAIATDLRKMISLLYGNFVSNDGKTVDYESMSKSDQFASYERLSEELQRTNLETLTHNERLAFFLNIYNALVIHWRIAKGPARSSIERLNAFRTAAYVIGGRRYTLNDIEHGILRGNKRPPYLPFRQIPSNDFARLRYVFDLSQVDPRIHFALNCGAKSCPPIRAYRGDKIDDQLNLATHAFLGADDNVMVVEKDNTVFLSKLFSWYAQDFSGGSKQNVLQWIYEHLPDDDQSASGVIGKKATFGKLLKDNRWKVKYFDYDWGHNSISS